MLAVWEQRIYEMWHLVKAHKIMPWEHDPAYEDNEHILKPEDKADILRMDMLEVMGENYKAMMKEGYKK